MAINAPLQIPTINQQLPPNIEAEMLMQQLKAGALAGNAGAEGAQKAQSEKELAGLQAMLSGQATKEKIAEEEASKGRLQEQTIQRQQELKDSNPGSNKSVSVGPDTVSTSEYNPFLASNKGADQAGKFGKVVRDQYKPISDQLSASRTALDYLNQGNATSDKLALIAEARLSAGQGGSRAISSILPQIGGDPSLATNAQAFENWLNNTPNIPKLQPAARDALRESIFARTPALLQSHQQAQQSLLTMGQQQAPLANVNDIVGAYANPATQNIDYLQKAQQEYTTHHKANPVSAPSTSSNNPTTMQSIIGGIKGLLGGGQAPQPAPGANQAPAQPQAQPPVDPIAAEMKRRGLAQ